MKAEPVSGYDLTFSAPKSVSVLFAVGEPDVRAAVREGHDAAVRDAVGYLEREACVTRRGSGGWRRLDGSGFLAAAYRHVASRARDPQLHTHVVVANMTEAEGRWSRLDGASLFRHGKTAGYLYQASLRLELSERLGVGWGLIENGYAEVAGVPREVIVEFSRRRAAIEEELRRRGLTGPRAAQVAALDTRESKDLALAPARLHDEWRARAAEHGLTRARVGELLNSAQVRRPTEQHLAAVARRLGGPEGLTKRLSAFDRRDVVQAWATVMGQAHTAEIERLADGWLASHHAQQVEPDQGAGRPARFSTPELLATERRLERQVRDGRRGAAAVVSAAAVERALAQRPTITEEQATLVRAVCSSNAAVDVVRGLAGTGKTFALSVARSAFEQDGYDVIGCALQGKAALVLQREARIPARTVAKLLIDLRAGEGLTGRSVLVVDEAGMVGTRHLAEIVEHAGRAHAKVVLLGDEGQLPELDAGGAFGHLARRHRTAELRRVVRQRDRRDVTALNLIRHGYASEALASLSSRGRLVTADDADGTRKAMLRAWRSGHERRTEGAAVMLARRHRDVRELNVLARGVLRAEGCLGPDVVLGDAAFAVNDRVIAGTNVRSLNVRNGMLGTVIFIDTTRCVVHVAADDGHELRLPFAYAAGLRPDGLRQLDHGYAMTVHRAQGSTWARTYLLASQDLFREEAYTALSRHTQEVTVFMTVNSLCDLVDDDQQDLATAVSRSRAQRLGGRVAERWLSSVER